MSADLLRRAAAMLRETAAPATPGPWVSLDKGDRIIHSAEPFDYEYVVDEPMSNEHNAAWIALMHPGLAEPLAAWLDFAAEYWRPEALAMKYPIRHDLQHRTLEIARAILGEAADE